MEIKYDLYRMIEDFLRFVFSVSANKLDSLV